MSASNCSISCEFETQVVALAEKDRAAKGNIEYCDCYHSINRFTSGPADHVPVVLPSSLIWTFKRNRLIIGAST